KADNAAKDAAMKRWRSECERAQSQNVVLAEQISSLEADNAALTARVKELELQLSASKETAKIKRVEYLDLDQDHSELKADYAVSEAQLKAAKKALEPFANHAKERAVDAPEWRDADTVQIVVTVGELRKARAVLGGKP